MTAQPADRMLPEPEQPAQTAREAGYTNGRSEAPFFPTNLPKSVRRDYARGYVRGCVDRARALREDTA